MVLQDVHGGDMVNTRFTDDFLRVVEAKKPRAQDNKALRLEESQLIELLAEKFRMYKYWSLKSLKEATRQPEAHLREVLGKIAMLVKTGQAANHYMLKPQMEDAVRGMVNADVAMTGVNVEGAVEMHEIAPDVATPQEVDLDDDDEEMEDVL
jgi:transcription initiation factor TFIIF subunit beta